MPRSRPLTPAVIAETALRFGDREGPQAMSMRRIAGELGCDPMALYRHYADREALLDAVADLALADAADPDPAGSWEGRLRAVVTAIRSAALRHPGIAAQIAARPPLGPQGRRLGAAMMTALRDAGLPEPLVVKAAQTLVAYLAAGLAMSTRAGTRDARWEQVSQAIDELPGGPPGRDLLIAGSDEQFEFGLRLLISGIRVEAGSARQRPGSSK
ncbi:TetR/AcrR family transcriptional regulator [Allorhizocola rhizosphaerae]|uniref:TetR/AcrR family transcriptional regulator n=1 Tax=Allorhizocola rhizosphaerae TaxID=1872709 RepID=UPI0013C377DC|nr:TetR/AcrR family transcriptional regulator C-terminal domain-containing protein [Allorhizocola rhizosphaerae]